MENWKAGFLILFILYSYVDCATICSSSSSPSLIDLSSFTSSSGLTYNGRVGALVPIGGSNPLRMNNGAGRSDFGYFEVSTVYTTNPITFPSDMSFSTYFQFKIYDNVGINDPDPSDNTPGADGIMFIIQDNDKTSIPPTSFGYKDLPRSFGVEIDTFMDNGIDPGDGNHIGFNYASNIQSYSTHKSTTRFNNGQVWYVWIDYNGGSKTIEVRVSQTSIRPQDYFWKDTNTGILSQVGRNIAYVGFGASVTTSGSTQEILKWKFRTGYNPYYETGCDVGYYYNGISCLQCPNGTYQDEQNSNCCKSCPINTTSDIGSTSISNCYCSLLDLCQVCSIPLQTYSVDLDNFDPSTGTNLVYGSLASSLNPSGGTNPLRLTNGVGPNNGGSLGFGQAYTTNKVPFSSNMSFSTYFQFKLSNTIGVNDPDPSDSSPGGDGISFIIQDISNNPTGNLKLGYQYLSSSIEIEIDTYYNQEDSDPNGNHIGLNLNGNVQSTLTSIISPRLNNGNIWHMWIDYNGETKKIQVRISQTNSRPITANIDYTLSNPLSSYVNQNAYVGFGGSVYGSGQTQEIYEWKFRNTYLPYLLCGVGKYQNGSICSNCPGGYYQDQIDSNCCQSCPSGTFSLPSSISISNCTSCPFGYWSSQHSSSCQLCSCEGGGCDAQTGVCTCPISRTGSNCEFCVSGYYGENCTQCINCGKGSCNDGINENGSCICNIGYKVNGFGVCNLCDIGFGGPNCLRCPEGCKVCSSSSSICEICEDGKLIYGGGCVDECPEGTQSSGGVCEGACFVPNIPVNIDLSSFSPDNSNLTFSGFANDLNPSGGANSLLLNIPILGSYGQMYTSDEIQFNSQMSFSTFFEFVILTSYLPSDPFDSKKGGDGLSFIIQRNSNSPNISNFQLGFLNIGEESFGIEIDTFYNGEFEDPNGNHIGINTKGSLKSIETYMMNETDGDLTNTKSWFIWIDYDGSTNELGIRLSSNQTRPTSPIIEINDFDLLEVMEGNAEGYVGFGGSSINSTSSHLIKYWKFRNIYFPYDNNCGDGYYFNGMNCSNCPLGTYSDLDGTCCKGCSAGTFSLGDSSTCSPCPSNTWSIPSSPSCQECTCLNGICNALDGTCESCFNGWIGLNCEICPTGYYGENCTQCINCGKGSCNDGINGTGSCTCNIGYKTDDFGVCTLCDIGFGGPNCLGCESEGCLECPTKISKCTNCGNGTLFYQDSCVSTCPISFYSDGSQCLSCDKSCKSCDGPSEDDCLSCNDFREILFNDISNTTGQCVCKENTFEFPNSTLGYVNRECWGCDISCEASKCIPGLPTQCITCAPLYIRIDAYCIFSNTTQETNTTPPPTNGPTNNPTDAPTDVPNGASKNSNALAIGIGVGAGGGLILLFLIVFFIVFSRRSKKKKNLDLSDKFFLEMTPSGIISPYLTRDFNDQDATMLNTAIEISLPGFLSLSYEDQIRQERQISQGGAGVLYEGTLLDPQLIQKYNCHKVAIKMIPQLPQYTSEENADIFKREVSVMWSLSFHPNIVSLIGFCDEPRCIITKLYENDLHTLIHKEPEKISLGQKILLLNDIISGLASIHEMNIAHRDIKASNILILTEQQTGEKLKRGVICDFGLAFVGDDRRIGLYNSKETHLRGFSPRYAAPEVFARSRSDTPFDVVEEKRSDVYAYGILTWEVVTETIPWEDETIESIEGKVRSGERPQPIPDDGNKTEMKFLIDLMKACWNGNPTQRPQSQDVFSSFRTKLS